MRKHTLCAVEHDDSEAKAKLYDERKDDILRKLRANKEKRRRKEKEKKKDDAVEESTVCSEPRGVLST